MIKLKKICVHKYELLHVKLLGLRMTSPCNNKENTTRKIFKNALSPRILLLHNEKHVDKNVPSSPWPLIKT